MPSLALDTAPIPVYHTRGPSACGQIAFGVCVHHPLDGETFPAANVRRLDGTAPIRGEVPVCGSCGATLGSFAQVTYTPIPLDPTAALEPAVVRAVPRLRKRSRR